MSERRPGKVDEDVSPERKKRDYPPAPRDPELEKKLGRIAVEGTERQARAERQARVARDGGRLATERAVRDDRERPQERER